VADLEGKGVKVGPGFLEGINNRGSEEIEFF
jgi:hypothetical protein